MYIAIVGPPAVRKSTAFGITSKLLRKYTGVKFAPDDTGGQRQGMIAAMMNNKGEENDTDEAIIAALAAETKKVGKGDGSSTSLTDLSTALAELGGINIDTRDPHTLFIAASEMNSVLGEGNTALLTFLQKMYDGEAYNYQLKSTVLELKEALLGMIAATTPGQIALALPSEAIGQGFTSRVLFVFADKKHARKIARPQLDKEIEDELGSIYQRVFNEFNGPFNEEAAAASKMDELYERGITINDPRFVYYAERRHTHLQKLTMSLAASRGENTIRLIDVNFADQLLLYTEQFMPEALGEYGMNKLSAAKQRLMEYMKGTTEPVPTAALQGLMSRDMTAMEFRSCIMDLHNAGKVSVTTLPIIGQVIIGISDNAARKAKHQLSEISQLMARN